MSVVTSTVARRWLVSVLALLVSMASCTSAPGGDRSSLPPVSLSWARVELSDDAEPVTLTAVGSQVLVGAEDSAGPVHPRLFTVGSGAAAREVRVAPRSPYGRLARWQVVAADGTNVVAVGGHPGGAHANTRWTTWSGTTALVTETPQPFTTFGGWGAGDLTGAVITATGPALVGTWQGARAGLDGAIWLLREERWVRQPRPDPTLQSTADLLVGTRSAAGSGASLVIVGSVLHLGSGNLRQAAAVWRSRSLSRGWTRVELPDAGARSEAVSVGCSAGQCLLAGAVDGRYALWSTEASTAHRLPGLPDLPIDISDDLPVPISRDGHSVAVVPSKGTTTVLSGEKESWSVANGPDGAATSAALVGDELFAITQRGHEAARLWRTPAQPLFR